MAQTRRHYVIEVFHPGTGDQEVLHFYWNTDKGNKDKPPLEEVVDFIKKKSEYRGTWYMVTAHIWKMIKTQDYDWSEHYVYNEHLGGEA